MAFLNCDVAFNGIHEQRYPAPGKPSGLFCRTDVSAVGAWAAVDTHPNGDAFLITSFDQLVRRPAPRLLGRIDHAAFEALATPADRRRAQLLARQIELGPRYPNNPVYIRETTSPGIFRILVVTTPVFGRAFLWDSVTDILTELPHFDTSGSGSQGFLDVSRDGVITWWDQNNDVMLDGIRVRSPLRRGNYTACVPQDTFLGIAVYDHVAPKGQQWFRPYPFEVQLLPRIAENGTVAASANPGGFIPRAEWLTRPFDPHPTQEVRMVLYNANAAAALRGELVDHPDGPPWKGVKKPNGKYVCVTPSGAIEERDWLQSWERFRVASNNAQLIAERDGGRTWTLAFAPQ